MNQLYYGDNLQVLREHLADESVDLIYLDPPAWTKPLRRGEGPPFNSKRDYNLLFKSPKVGSSRCDDRTTQRAVPTTDYSEAQIEAFEDTWHWNQQAEREFDELLHQPNTDVAEIPRNVCRHLLNT